MKYWVYMNGEVPGSYEPEELTSLPGFQETAMVCPTEGGLEERNWRRAGQFPDIIEVLRRQQRETPPSTALDIQPGPAREPDDVLNDVSSKIFGHVTELMKELENRREERALCQSLQRQLIELKNDVQALRERNLYLQERVDLLPGFQKRENKLEEKIRQLEADARISEDQISLLDTKGKELRAELERTIKSEKDLSGDLIRQSRMSEELNTKLAEKELQLARAFGMITKFEAMLGDIVPGATAGMQPRAVGPQTDDIDLPEKAQETPEPEPEPVPEPEPAPEPIVEAAATRGAESEASASTSPSEAAAVQDEVETPPQEHNGNYTVDTEMTDLKPDWPEEGEVKPVPPPWKVRLRKFSDDVKDRIAKLSKPKEPPPTDDPPAETG